MKKIATLMLTFALATLSLTSLTACTSNTSTPTNAPASSEATTTAAAVTEAAKSEAASADTTPASQGGTVGFVTFGLGGDFFQQLADSFVAKMESIGWNASYADGNFNPTTQIEACENYIAMGVDVLVVWSVAPEAMANVVTQAEAAGIKFVSFVADTGNYDILLVADNEDLAEGCALLAADWIDKTFANEPDHSVPVAVFTDRTADTGTVQGDILLKIEDYSKKAKFTTEVACSSEDIATGLSNAENIYITNPEIKAFLTAHNGLALGINNYFTSINSPVTDYNDMGIFTVNGDDAAAELIKSSGENKSPFRGMVLTGSVSQTADEIAWAVTGVFDGSIAKGTIKQADNTFVNIATVDEYLSTGTVVSVSKADFE